MLVNITDIMHINTFTRYTTPIILFSLWCYLLRVLFMWKRKPLSVSEIHTVGNRSERANLTFLWCCLGYNLFIMTNSRVHLLLPLLSIVPLRSNKKEILVCFAVSPPLLTILHQLIGLCYFITAPVLWYLSSGNINVMFIELVGFIMVVYLIDKKLYPISLIAEAALTTILAINRM